MRKLLNALPFLAFVLALAGLFLPAAAVEPRGMSERFGPWAIVSDGDNLLFQSGGSDVITYGANPGASASGDIQDFTLTLAIQNGSDAFALWDVNLTNANHTGSGNTVRVLDIAGVTQDTQSQENAIQIATGWDLDLNGATSLDLGTDDVLVVSISDPQAADAAGTSSGLKIAYAEAVHTTGTNTDYGLNVAVTSANATGGTNTLYGIEVGTITADAQITEYAIDVASGWDRGLNIAGGGAVIVGTFTVDANEIGAAEISNPTRNIQISLQDFFECTTDAGASLDDYSSGADAFPDYFNSATDGIGGGLRFDDTGGSVDTARICTSFQVPQDYASGFDLRVSLAKDAETGANTEVLNGNCNEAFGALGTADTDTITGAAEQEIASSPTGCSLAAGDTIGITLWITSGGTVDDIVDIYSVVFEYTATQ